MKSEKQSADAIRRYKPVKSRIHFKPLLSSATCTATLREIHNGMLYLRAREAELRDLNEATNSRVAWLSIVSLAVCIALCVWQIFYLKNFFQRKKLL
jgi:hypothetical protein